MLTSADTLCWMQLHVGRSFCGEKHALLYRKWKSRVKGRHWYGLMWYVIHRPCLHLAHFEQRMFPSGHWTYDEPITNWYFHN